MGISTGLRSGRLKPGTAGSSFFLRRNSTWRRVKLRGEKLNADNILLEVQLFLKLPLSFQVLGNNTAHLLVFLSWFVLGFRHLLSQIS